jgi:hypothetical protein
LYHAINRATDLNMVMLTNMQDTQGKVKSAEVDAHKKGEMVRALQEELYVGRRAPHTMPCFFRVVCQCRAISPTA